MKATFTTKIKSFSDVVKHNNLDIGKVSPESLQTTIRTTLQKQDREKSVMAFGRDILDNDTPEDSVKKVWAEIGPS